MKFDKDKAFMDMKSRLSEKRFQHSLNVAKTAVILAKRYGVSTEKAEIAGLFHDFAKYMDSCESLRQLRKIGESNEFILNNPCLAHGKIAKYILNKDYGLGDEEILSAIEKHTFGSKEMSDLDKVVFLADAIEPKRNYPSCDKIRKTSEINLDLACFKYLKTNFKYLIKNKMPVSVDSIEMYNSLLNKIM